jgi:hypothetical protein
MLQYQLRDENQELMRVVARKEEAQQLLNLRPEWQVKAVKQPKPEPHKFEEALF